MLVSGRPCWPLPSQTLPAAQTLLRTPHPKSIVWACEDSCLGTCELPRPSCASTGVPEARAGEPGRAHTCRGSSSKGGRWESLHKIPEPRGPSALLAGATSQNWEVLGTHSPF